MVAKVDQKVLTTLLVSAQQHYQARNLKAAKAAYTQLLKHDPDHAEALHLLGCVCEEMGSSSQAIKLLTRAVKANPKAHAYFYNLANMLLRQGQLPEAIRYYREAIRIKPDYAFAHNNLGMALSNMGQRAEAVLCFQNAIQSKTGYADPHQNLGIELKALGDMDGAIAAFGAAIQIKPDFIDAYRSLGSTHLSQQRIVEAAKAYEKATQLLPRDAKNQTNLGAALLQLGRQSEAIACFQKALQLNPSDALTRSNLLLATSYVSSNPLELNAIGESWEQVHGAALRSAIEAHQNDPDPQRRLRVGYVSGDLRNHAAAYWIEPLLSGSEHRQFEIFCYNNNAAEDATTQRLKPMADHWIDCFALGDEALAKRIRQDGIDILVDLSSHTHGNRLLVFAQQPAPIQVSWFGLPVSTGLRTMQYRFSDAIVDPEVSGDTLNSEKIVRLNRFYAAYRPNPMAPAIGPGPVEQGKGLCFASLNTLAKITRPMLDLWADILCEVAESRLLMQSAGLDSDDLAAHVRSIFTQRGIAPERVELRGWSDMSGFLRIGEEADIALDPFPFNGGVTTCHALWMGLPVITQCAQAAPSRIGASILNRMGLQELVAGDPRAYVAAAVNLAGDHKKLAQLRQSMRERMEAGGLLNGVDLAQQAQTAYRHMWRDWCASR